MTEAIEQTRKGDGTHSTSASRAIDNTDWLKTAAIVLVTIDHVGYFFIENADWWSVAGRFAAPPFFFLLGYAQTRTVPLRWLWLGVILTLLDGWNHNWAWVAPNILFSFALIRLGRPLAQGLVQRHGWAAVAPLALVLFALLPVTENIVDYGAEGWLWALLGLCQRLYVDGTSAIGATGAGQSSKADAGSATTSVGFMRIAACFVAAAGYVWQEQAEFLFSRIEFAVFALGVGVLSAGLCLFRRGPSIIQPPKAPASVLRFIGRHTLEIYAVELASFELIVKFVPALAA